MLEVMKLKEDFPALSREVNGKGLVYLDNAATTQKPESVIESMNNYYRNYNANVHRGIHKLSEEASQSYEIAHRKVAEFIGAKSWREIIFTKNTTEAINLIAYSYALENLTEEDNIVLSVMEHHSNLVPWQFVSKKTGCDLRFIDVDGEGNLKDWDKIIDSNTKIVSITHASNVLGTINPINDITRAAHDVGAVIIVDGAQSAPHIKIDVDKLDCDFFVFSSHKMCGPTGIGVLYAKKEILNQMEPFLYGGGMISRVSKDESSWNELPWKFEAGTPPIAEAIGFAEAINYIQSIGLEKIEEYEKDLTEYALEKLKSVKGLVLYGPDTSENRTSTISFNVGNIHAHDLSSILDREGIAIRAGHHCSHPLMKRLEIKACARASLYFYNTKEDIDRLCDGIEKAKNIFGE